MFSSWPETAQDVNAYNKRMASWIALFRGINVGGKNVLLMKDLVVLLEGLGCEDVKTYIQSGNAIFRSAELDASALEESISKAVSELFDFRPRVIVLGVGQFRQAAASNLFPEAEAEPRTLHLFFFGQRADAPDVEGLDAAKSASESFVLTAQVFYLHAPDGIGRSNLARAAERLIGVDVTARNWNTVARLLVMAEDFTD